MGNVALSGIPAPSSRFSPAPRFPSFSHAPPPCKVAWASPCPVPLGGGGTPRPAITGGSLALDFQKPRQAGRIPICETASHRARLPHLEAEAGFRCGVPGVSPGPSPGRLELQEGKAVAGILERQPPASPPGSGWETAMGPRTQATGRGQPWLHMGQHRWKPACPRP